MNRVALLVATFTVCVSAGAQGDLEEVLVTASRISGNSYYDTPVVTISKTADFMTQSITLVNDSRSPERRPAELIKTIENMMNAAKKLKGIELSYGEGFLTPVVIDEDILRTIENDEDDEISGISIVAKVAVDKGRSTRQQIADLNKFIDNAKLDGRTEIETYGDVGLSIINPQQYRTELLKSIASENKRMAQLMGDDCTIKISGLENRLQWVRGSIDELKLYVDYSTEVAC